MNYEKFYIFYNKENKFVYIDFRIVYVLNKISMGFKVYFIKNIDKIGSK